MRFALTLPSRQCLLWLARWPTAFVVGVTLVVIALTSCGLGVSRNREATSIQLQFGVVTITAHETIGPRFVPFFPGSPADEGWWIGWTPEYASWRAPYLFWRPESREGAVPGIYLDNRTGRFRETKIPLWPMAALGLVISIPAWRSFLRRGHRLRNSLCVGCGYSGIGLPSSPGRVRRCPECGLEEVGTRISPLGTARP